MLQIRRLCLLLVSLWACSVQAVELRIAVAANFKTTLQRLIPTFEQQSGHRVTISSASTGVLYAQILRGAPFDLFLAADSERPRLLEQRGHTLPRSRLTYARGRLALWRPKARHPVSDVDLPQLRRLAIANPKTAPYGRAATEVLQHFGSLPGLQLVRGNNIAQAFQFVESGNVGAGLVALSLLRQTSQPPRQFWLLPEALHSPIDQQLVGLKATPHPQAVHSFIAFIMQPEAQQRIAAAGYGADTPG